MTDSAVFVTTLPLFAVVESDDHVASVARNSKHQPAAAANRLRGHADWRYVRLCGGACGCVCVCVCVCVCEVRWEVCADYRGVSSHVRRQVVGVRVERSMCLCAH